MTSELFRSFHILSHFYIAKSIENGKPLELMGFDQGAFFRIITQNDQSVFYKEEVSIEKNTEKMSLDEKIEHCQHMQVSEDMVLSDCFIHNYDNDLNPMAMNLCNCTGATITSNIIPFLTTHIVVAKMTPVLKHTLNLFHS